MYGTHKLYSSKEGLTFNRPMKAVTNGITHIYPSVGAACSFVCTQPFHTNRGHFDQQSVHTGLHCLQSSILFLNQTPYNRCFLVYTGSYRVHHLRYHVTEVSMNKEDVIFTEERRVTLWYINPEQEHCFLDRILCVHASRVFDATQGLGK